MNRVRLLLHLAASLGLVSLLAAPSAFAQTFYGLSLGLTSAGPAPAASWPVPEYFSQGFAVQASVGRQVVPGFLSVRLDAFTSRFNDIRPTLSGIVPCSSSGSCVAFGFTKPVGLVGLSASGMMSLEDPVSGAGVYLIVGAGADYLYQHPVAQGAVRPDLSAGAGVTVRLASRLGVFLEVHCHGLLGPATSPSWLVPVTFGIRF
jgi:hypothetical protein